MLTSRRWETPVEHSFIELHHRRIVYVSRLLDLYTAPMLNPLPQNIRGRLGC